MFLYFLVHLQQFLLPLFFLVLLHKLLNHFLSGLFALLSNVFLDELVHAAQLLLLRHIRETLRDCSLSLWLTPFVLIWGKWFEYTIKLALIGLSRQDLSGKIRFTVESNTEDVVFHINMGPSWAILLRSLRLLASCGLWTLAWKLGSIESQVPKILVLCHVQQV